MNSPTTLPAPSSFVLFTRRHDPRLPTSPDETQFPAIVTKVFPHGCVNLCAFTPAPEPVWCVDFDATGKPGTWRQLNK